MTRRSGAGSANRGSAPYFEIQIHPSDLRRGVRYLFVSRRQAMALAGGLIGILAFVGFSLAVLPGVARDLVGFRAYGGFSVQRSAEGQRLRDLATEFSALAEQGSLLRQRVEKIHLAYGLELRPSAGQGGFPLAAAEAPDSIYAATIAKVNTAEALLREQLQVVGAFLEEAAAYEKAHEDRIAFTPSASPLRGDSFVLTSPFGTRRNPFTKAIDFHAGLDLAAPSGTDIHAPATGVVTYAGRYPLRQSVAWWRYGNMVAIRHGDEFVTIFGHCTTLLVKSGQSVKQGDRIATVGSTGWSTSPHLHYEVRRRGIDGKLEPVDPRIYILDHRWTDEDQILVRRRSAPESPFDPLPPVLGR